MMQFAGQPSGGRVCVMLSSVVFPSSQVSPASTLPLPQTGPGRVVVVVVGPTFSSPTTSLTNESTFASIAPLSPVVLQPGLASSLSYAALTLAWHLASFAGSTVPPAAATFDSSPVTHCAFLPASLIFAPWHLFGSVPTASSETRSFTKESTLPSIAFLSPVVLQTGLASSL